MIKTYTPEDHAMLAEWWTAHKWVPVVEAMLPPTGYIAYAGDKPIIAGFIYILRDVKLMAWVEWVVSNPDTTPEERTDGFAELMGHLDAVAKENGVATLFTTSDNTGYIKRMELAGYNAMSTGQTHLFKIFGVTDQGQ